MNGEKLNRIKIQSKYLKVLLTILTISLFFGLVAPVMAETIPPPLKQNDSVSDIHDVECKPADSPADKADLRGSSQSKTVDDVEHIIGGDIIVSIDDNEVRKIDDILIHLQREKSVGDEIELGIIRDNTESTITVTLGERPPSS